MNENILHMDTIHNIAHVQNNWELEFFVEFTGVPNAAKMETAIQKWLEDKVGDLQAASVKVERYQYFVVAPARQIIRVRVKNYNEVVQKFLSERRRRK